jgi:hypothetical protein
MNASLWISLLAVGVSLFALGWNVYRDVVMKPRLKVDLAFATIKRTEAGGNPLCALNKRRIPPNNPFVLLEGVNHGPGQIRCSAIMAIGKDKDKDSMKRLGVIVHDTGHEVSDSLPKALEVGEPIQLAIPLFDNCFLREDVVRVGIKDSFGRIHWAPRRTVRIMRKAFRKQQIM